MRVELERTGLVKSVSSWTDVPDDLESTATPADYAKVWSRCVKESSAADVWLSLFRTQDHHNGQLCEIGCALANGRKVLVVRPAGYKVGDCGYHSSVTQFDTLEHAVAAILEMAILPLARASSNIG